ncbi:hypothetical protein QUF55_08450 [Clostridiaceae bacterium HSG29]|nr:hypothetical protein [Clostridiaceae bacterium HSG29]
MKQKKAISKETFVLLLFIIIAFGYLSSKMGVGPMFNTIMKTAHDLLLSTVFFIMAIAVLAGAFSALLSEFGVVALINMIISPIMKPLYKLPGAASLGAITTYLSDNPAIISLSKDKGFIRYFKNYQVPVLCNLGTSFGMGLILSTFMISQGEGTEFVIPVIIGNIAAIIGSIVSVRIMMHYTKIYYNVTKEDIEKEKEDKKNELKFNEFREIREGSPLERGLDAILEGGKNGVEMGLEIIPGVLVICTMIMILTFGPSEVNNGIAVYKGLAYEGVELLPKIGSLLSPILKPLFGFRNASAIAFPITSLGSVGAALGLVTKFINEGLISGNEIAVFTAMGMCWSGYLSTHVGMMDSLGVRRLANKAIFSHTIGGLLAGISAHLLFVVSNL